MKKMLLITIAAMFLFTTLITLTTAGASEDRIISAKIISIDKRVSKKGNTYVKMIIEEKKVLQGTSYMAEMPVLAFGVRKYKKALTMKPGDTLNAVVKASEYKGSMSYVIRAYLETVVRKRK